MDEEKRVSSEAQDDASQPNAAAQGRPTSEAAAMAEAQNAEGYAAEIATLKAQNDEVTDRNLRLVAEMENLRRRTERDKSDFAKYAISEFARDILTVGDNIRRAIEAVPKEAVLSHPALTSLIEGVEVTERDLIKVLERYQVKRFDPLGEMFNPHFHEAMTKVDVPNVPADTVIQVIHAGYMIGERVLRPAAVIVAKGGAVAEQPVKGGGDPDTVPPGAMRVPSDAVSSSSPEPADFTAARDRADSRRASESNGKEAWAGDRVSQMPRSRANGAGPAYQNSGKNRAGASQSRSSTLHKPVIDPKV